MLRQHIVNSLSIRSALLKFYENDKIHKRSLCKALSADDHPYQKPDDHQDIPSKTPGETLFCPRLGGIQKAHWFIIFPFRSQLRQRTTASSHRWVDIVRMRCRIIFPVLASSSACSNLGYFFIEKNGFRHGHIFNASLHFGTHWLAGSAGVTLCHSETVTIMRYARHVDCFLCVQPFCFFASLFPRVCRFSPHHICLARASSIKGQDIALQAAGSKEERCSVESSNSPSTQNLDISYYCGIPRLTSLGNPTKNHSEVVNSRRFLIFSHIPKNEEAPQTWQVFTWLILGYLFYTQRYESSYQRFFSPHHGSDIVPLFSFLCLSGSISVDSGVLSKYQYKTRKLSNNEISPIGIYLEL